VGVVLLVSAIVMATSLHEAEEVSPRPIAPSSGPSLAVIGPSPAPSTPLPSEGTTVPDVVGLTAFEAVQLLAEADLVVARIEPVAGQPGSVVGSEPAVGERVAIDTAVVLFIGTQPERIREEG
jgi:hypothetical protein